MNLPELTVVVTTFRRPKRLRKCLQSLVDAGVERVVVTGSGYTAKDGAVIEEFRTKFPQFASTWKSVDLGANETWLRGVTYATTKFVLIMHDDDQLMPAFSRAYVEKIHPQLDRGVGFATWRGKVVSDVNEVDDTVGCLKGPTRICSSGVVTKTLLGRVTSPSPIISVFRRDVSIRVLRECELMLTEHKYFSRPKMLIGNDILLPLRHAELYSDWFFLDEILSIHGGWFGSETARHQGKKLGKLIKHYDEVREHFRRVRVHDVPPSPKFFHVYTAFVPTKKSDQRRYKMAQSTWENSFLHGDSYPVPVADGFFPRDSKTDLADVRAVPYIHDMMDYAASFALPEDYLLFSNADIGFVSHAWDRFRQEFNSGANSFYAWRRNLHYKVDFAPKDIRTGQEDGGVDAWGIRPDVWHQHKHEFPRFLVSNEGWDWQLRLWLPSLNGNRPGLSNLIWHEYHSPFWRRPDIRFANPGQKYNRELLRGWFVRRCDFKTQVKETGWEKGQ